MFVASSLYNYATGSSSSTGKADGPTPTNTRVKRHPIRKRGAGGVGLHERDVPTSPPPSYASVAAGQQPASASIHEQLANEQARQQQRTAAELTKIAVIDSIVQEEDLYKVLAVKRNAKPDEIRRGFLNRSRVCHPDKFPSYTPCVLAFQKVSLAYQTLSKPSSRRMYDVSGRSDLAAALNNDNGHGGPNGGAAGATDLGSDETLNGVLYSVFCEIFLDGDLEMIRVLINALNESNPGLNLGDDAVNSIEDAFAKLREIALAGKKYLSIIRFELIRLYEIQHSLRQLSYFDVFGRLRLTLQLARVTLSIPMAIDQAMKEPEEGSEDAADKDGLLNEKTAGVGFDGADLDDDNGSSSSDEGDEDHSSDEERPKEDDFGMRAEDPDSDEEGHGDGGGGGGANNKRDRHSKKTGERLHRRASRRARVEAAKKARIKEQEEKTLQRKGLLGPTAAGLLNGVVKVLETSEAWVPGSRKDSSDD